MTLAVIIVIAAVLALTGIVRFAVGRSLQTSRSAEISGQIRPIDVEAFRNLVSASEDDYLRRRLPPSDFRLVRRARLRAMAAYVKEVGGNAARLVQIGQAALAAGDPRTAEAARELVNNALLLRRNTALALLQIYVALALPNSALTGAQIVERYERLSRSAMLLGRLQNPTVAVRLSATR